MSQRKLLQTEGLTRDSLQETTKDSVSIILIISSLTAAWIAAGSTGLLSHPLRKVLTLIFLIMAVFSQRPFPWKKNSSRLVIIITALIAVYMITSPLPAINLMAVSLVLAGLSIISSGRAKRISEILSVSVLVFAVYRMAYTCIPSVWLLSDNISRVLGNIASFITHKPLLAGPSLAGIDFLVLMSALWILRLTATHEPKRTRAIYGFLGIFGGHLIYLIVLSYAPELIEMIPVQGAEATAGQAWSWAGFLHKAVPWNLPVVACGIHLLIATAFFRWPQWSAENTRETKSLPLSLDRKKIIFCIAAVVLAVLLPVILAFFPNQLKLEGKKIVIYEKGFLNWLKPEHGQYGRLSSGMYGMLPIFIESMGASALISENLSQQDLSGADVLVLLFPDDPWTDGQLERIWDFVNEGGSLLVLGEHTTRDSNGSNRFNEVLEPTNISVEFDSATFTIGGWLQSYEAIAHPATAGIRDERNQFGVVIGASLNIDWPARPLLIGKWGWSDMGDQGSDRAMMGDDIYNPGERLGDLILAAEQPLGKGRVIAFGDTSGFTNGINVSSYVFTSKIFGYLAGHGKNAHPIWRQILGIILCALLIVILFGRTNQWNIVLIILLLSTSLALSNIVSQRSGKIYPDGRYKSPNNVAYVDSSHLEAYSGESWRPDGVGGLILTLMRNDYFPMSLSKFSAEQLACADLFISIAPSRNFSKKERDAIRDFVMNGGDVIITVGMDKAGPGRSLLSMFGFTIGSERPDVLEPTPLGYFKSPYLSSGSRQVFVRFHAAWAVYCNDPQARVIAYGRNDQPVIIMRKFGAGKVVVIGDTCFAMNKNLEWEGGEPFEGMRENADFWRWFITVLRDQEGSWIPPALQNQSPVENSEQEVAN